jgi:formylmethanofuran dehydrogenase subunit E
MMRALEDYIAEAARVHGHTCAGQVLGIRMAMYGLRLLGIDDPQGPDRKRLVTFVEIDRCATDAVSLVTGCRLGKRALKFRDFGKVAATFMDLKTSRAVRLIVHESARPLARSMFPELSDRNQQQAAAYRVMEDTDLFDHQWVRVELPPEDLPGYKGARARCEQCGEAINFRRQVLRDGRVLCRACAGESYYQIVNGTQINTDSH